MFPVVPLLTFAIDAGQILVVEGKERRPGVKPHETPHVPPSVRQESFSWGLKLSSKGLYSKKNTTRKRNLLPVLALPTFF